MLVLYTVNSMLANSPGHCTTHFDIAQYSLEIAQLCEKASFPDSDVKVQWSTFSTGSIECIGGAEKVLLAKVKNASGSIGIFY